MLTSVALAGKLLYSSTHFADFLSNIYLFAVRSSSTKCGTESKRCSVFTIWLSCCCQGSWWEQRSTFFRWILFPHQRRVRSLVEGRSAECLQHFCCDDNQHRRTVRQAQWFWNMDWKHNKDKWQQQHQVKQCDTDLHNTNPTVIWRTFSCYFTPFLSHRCAVISNIPSGCTLYFSCGAIEGRYVTVLLPGNQKVLSLCEVEVYTVNYGNDTCHTVWSRYM